VHEAANQVWLADLTGNLMKEGTTTMNLKTISKKVAAMGGEINVSVGMDQVTISGAVLSEFAGDLITIMSDLVMNPAFPASEIDRLKNDLKRQLSVQKAQPQQQASEKFFQIIYPDHAYGRYFPTEDMLNAYTIDMVKDFYSKNFGAKRSVIYIAGKFDEAKVSAAIDKAFANWAAGPEVSYPAATPKRSNEVAQIDRKGAPQTTVIVGSRITRNIREDKGYTYSPFSTIQNRKGVSVWYEQADVTTEATGASLTEISKEINKLQKEVPSKEEAEGIQKYMAGTFVLQNSSPGGIIGQLNFLDLHGLDDSYLTDRVKNIYAVTPEKMSQIAKDYLKYEDMTLVLVGDKKEIEKQKKALEDARKLR
jgi:zinc protease